MTFVPPGGPAISRHTQPLERVLHVVSAFTLVMTVPQVWQIWIGRTASGVSILSWISYLIAACLWFIHGLRRNDRSIYLPCIGWIILDSAVVLGIIAYR
jgi:uncharacterized protein with PQ loop repeat